MSPDYDPYRPAGGPKVKADSLIPHEQRTSLTLLKSADTYQQCFLKYPQCGTFHSFPELLHAALLEADPAVTSFIPQPFKLRIGPKLYTPDCYFVRNGRRIAREVRSQGDFPEEWRVPVAHFFSRHDIEFEVVSNQEALEKETLALNWLHIVQLLVSSEGQDTSALEGDIHLEIAREGALSLLDLIDGRDEYTKFGREVSLYRLLHRGLLTADLDQTVLGYQTEFRLCG